MLKHERLQSENATLEIGSVLDGRCDDIDLPPIPEDKPSAGWSDCSGRSMEKGGSSGIYSAVMSLALLGAMAVGGWMFLAPASTESKHPNWQHVSAASDATSSGQAAVEHIDHLGVPKTVASIEVDHRDASRSMTRQARSAIARGDLLSTTLALFPSSAVAAQGANQTGLPALADLASLLTSLQKRDVELYEIEMFDCCHEDGDVVELLVNGAPYATVPILHQGTTVLVPLNSGNNSLTLRGVQDGGGGITISFRTSRGEFFSGAFAVGEEHQLGVLVR